VADARLDYRDELLGKLGTDLTLDSPDEALIAAAYLRFGEDFVDHLEGDFAFALFDARHERLILARDPYGVRALYLSELDDRLIFASQARALFADPGLVRRVDRLRVAEYLARTFANTERTFFHGVERLPAGHVLRVTREQSARRRYVAFRAVADVPVRPTREYTEAFRALFTRAVRERSRVHGGVGCMLSGGLDSAGVLSVLREASPLPVACFTARFPDFPEIDEGPWLSLHEAQGGLTLSEVRADRMGPLACAERVHELLDEPFHAPNLFIYEALATRAATAGVRVMLDGLDGDTVIEHGLHFMGELLHRGRLRRLYRELSALHARTGFSYPFMLRGWVFAHDRERALSSLFAHLPARAPRGYLDLAFARESGFLAGVSERAKQERRVPMRFHALHERAVNSPLMPFYLEVHDKLAAALGIDHRHPYFDRRLITFCLSLPAEQRLHAGWDRVIQRRAFEGLVPDPIRMRQSKSVWSRNFQRQLLDADGERVRALIEARPSPLEGLVDLSALRRDLPRMRAGAASERVLDLWAAATLGSWLERNPVTLVT
jgi:asparagine synthase (glutamine-hydrolysing)